MAANVERLMRLEKNSKTATALGKVSGVGRRTVDRLLKSSVAVNLDTLQAVADALGVSPWQLVLNGDAQKALSQVFGPHAPDERLGENWTRPDKKRLVDSDRNGQVKSTNKPHKIKTRG